MYQCKVVVDSNGELRPGMSVSAEIIVDQFDEATYVPVQAVVRRGGNPVVFVPGENGLRSARVTLGPSNSEMVRITEGLQPGQSVLLTPPLGGDDDNGTGQKRPKMADDEANPKTGEKKQASDGDSAGADKKGRQGKRGQTSESDAGERANAG